MSPEGEERSVLGQRLMQRKRPSVRANYALYETKRQKRVCVLYSCSGRAYMPSSRVAYLHAVLIYAKLRSQSTCICFYTRCYASVL